MRARPSGRHVALVVLACVAACSKAPPTPAPPPVTGSVILTLEELDQDRGKHLVTDRTGIADVNSTLEIRIDSTALRQRVSSLIGASAISPAVVTRLAALQAMAVARLELVQEYTEALQRYTDNKTEPNLKAVRDALRPLARNYRTLYAAAKADPGLNARLEGRLEAFLGSDEQRSVAMLYEMVLAFAGEEATAARRALEAEAQKAGVHIQVGTWLSTSQGIRPIAAASLNTTEPASPFVVDRWSVVLDEAQREQVRAHAQVATAVNREGPIALVKLLTAAAQSTLESMSGHLRECSAAVSGAAKDLTDNAGDSPPTQLLDQIRAHAATLEKSATDLAALADKYRARGTSTDAAAFLEATNADLATIRTTVENVAGTVRQIESALTALPATLLRGGDLDNGATGLKGKLKGCVTFIRERLEGVTAQFRDSGPTSRIVAVADSAWKDVLRYDLAAVPSTSSVQLITAGPRRAGDLVLIRLAATRGTDTQRQPLDEQQITLQRVLPHLELSVGLIFADPLGSSAVVRRFQAAPAYSVLYRRGSRRSLARNSFWNVGVGLNVAAPDFDKDDVPELGLGLTASMFSDLVQAGVGYNVFIDRAYWFFGVRLPVGTVSLGGSDAPADASAPTR